MVERRFDLRTFWMPKPVLFSQTHHLGRDVGETLLLRPISRGKGWAMRGSRTALVLQGEKAEVWEPLCEFSSGSGRWEAWWRNGVSQSSYISTLRAVVAYCRVEEMRCVLAWEQSWCWGERWEVPSVEEDWSGWSLTCENAHAPRYQDQRLPFLIEHGAGKEENLVLLVPHFFFL